MIKLSKFLMLMMVLESLKSCLFPLAPKHHYFTATDNVQQTNPKVSIFSTPHYKDYVVTGVDTNTQVYIKSPVFQNPVEFQELENGNDSAKHYKFQRRDRKFYRNTDYETITLKIVGRNFERVINYAIAGK